MKYIQGNKGLDLFLKGKQFLVQGKTKNGTNVIKAFINKQEATKFLNKNA